METIFFKNKQPFIYITLCFALICWIFLFAQILSNHIIAPAKETIPAFQPITDTYYQDNSMLSCPISAFSDSSVNKLPDQTTIYHFLKQYDKKIRLISCQKEKNYTDLYFYSPALQQKNTTKTSQNFNLQVAITKSKIYFGTPFLQYDF